MENSRNKFDALEDNLRRVGEELRSGTGPDGELLNRCRGAQGRPPALKWRFALRKYQRPLLLSSMGVAAALVVGVASVQFLTGPTVHAALVMEALAKQAKGDPVVELTIVDCVLDELRINGQLQVAKQAVAGDLAVEINGTDEQLSLDLSLAVQQGEGWVLVRKLFINDLMAQGFINVFLPIGTETLIQIPKGSELVDEFDVDLEEFDSIIHSGDLLERFEKLIAEHAHAGVSISPQSDGTVVLAMPIDNAEILETLFANEEATQAEGDARSEQQLEVKVRLKGEFDSQGKPKGDTKGAEPAVVDVESRVERVSKVESAGRQKDPSVEVLAGATLRVTYDPNTQAVRSLEVVDIGENKGHFTLRFRQGEIDPAMLDSRRVTKASTRVLDIEQMKNWLHSFKGIEVK